MTPVQDIISNLNQQQKEAVLHYEGPAIVLAGAGSGKTRVLTTRAAWLIKEKNILPENILLVTFTNKAASEMNNRVVELTGQRLPFSGTFHSLCARILRQESHHLGMSRDFSIYDTTDQLALIKQIYKKNNYDTTEHKPRAVKSKISQSKNEMLSVSDYEQVAQGGFQIFTAKVYREYQKSLLEQHAVDFDDLLNLAVDLFRKNPAVLDKYQNKITHVLVDEYQDTNKAQYFLTKYLSQPNNNLYVVGDFSQSIYAWRGADYRNLMHFKQDFKDINEYKLEQNYRSTQTILDAATQVISGNTSHPILHLWTDSENIEKIKVIETKTHETEAYKVAQLISEYTEGINADYRYGDIAILYRTNAQSRAFEEAFIKNAIPYKLVGGVKFYERKEIKDLLAYMRLTVNPLDTISRERAIKLGKRRFAKFELWMEDQPIVFNNELPYGVLEKILKVTDYLKKFKVKDPDDQSRIENIQELLNTASQFKTTTSFLENIALIQDKHFHDVEDGDESNVVTLMSLHSAKGLEFPIVFMVGMEEGLLPHSRAIWEAKDIEEERRLCYVGITRAKEKLILTHANSRMTYGRTSNSLRSRFLSEIDPELLELISLSNEKSYDNPNPHYGRPGSQPNSNKNYWQSKQQYQKPKKPSFTPERRLVMDDDALEALVNDEMDIKAFLDS